MPAMTDHLIQMSKQKAAQAELERRSGSDLEFLPKFKTASDVHKFAQQHGATMVDVTFTDVPGTLQHTTCPLHQLTDKSVEAGFGFDGSSIRGFQEIQESDMLLMPDLSTTILDTYSTEPTVSVLCDVYDPISHELYDTSPRTIAKKAVEYMKSTGVADTAYFGPEAEFFVFDNVQYSLSANKAGYEIDSVEAIWNTDSKSADSSNLGYKIRHKEGYFPGPPMDQHQELRIGIVRELERAGIKIENFHHEVATGGQGEIDMEYNDLLSMADSLIRYKYIARNVAARFGKSITFMPKPIFGDNGSGMHVHQSLWKDGDTLFAGGEYAGLSKTALHYIGGIIKHAPALTAITNPTTNSFKRLVPGFEAPVNFIYSARNRTAAIRIPMYHDTPKSKRIETRFPDPACNPYLAFSALLLAGLDGILNEIDPGDATDQNLYTLDKASLQAIPRAPFTLASALDALQADHTFLTQTGVFTESFIADFISDKRDEASAGEMRPTPWEFYQYYDV